jgi:hypothetical protein
VAKFKAARKVYNLRFTGDHEGLEIRAHGVSMGQLMDVAEQADRLDAGAGLGEVRELIILFISKVKDWNLQHETLDDVYEDTAVQADAFLMHDPALVKVVILAWVEAMVGSNRDLGKGSTSGSTFPEVSIPMAAA